MSRYRGSDLPRFIRRFRRQLSVMDLIKGRKVIVPRTFYTDPDTGKHEILDPGGIRRTTNRFGKRIEIPNGFTPEFRTTDGTVINPDTASKS